MLGSGLDGVGARVDVGAGVGTSIASGGAESGTDMVAVAVGVGATSVDPVKTGNMSVKPLMLRKSPATQPRLSELGSWT